jgi:hypothetical protein
MYNLNNNWTCWIHYQNDNIWTLDRYQNITTLATLKDAVLFIENLDENIIKKTMLFFMKDSILPLWESEDNINGGCFSYKINNINIVNIFKILLYKIIGNTLSTNETTLNNINGISISPKKNFCIIKIWMGNCNNQNPAIVTTDVNYIVPQGCIFKKHSPEF